MTEPTPIAGYRRKPRYVEIVYPADPEDGAQPLTVQIQWNLTVGQIDDINQVMKEGTFDDVFQEIAPYIKSWNHRAVALETGEAEPVPVPSEASWEVLKTLDHREVLWLVSNLRTAYLRGESEEDRKNDSGPSESGPELSSDSDSAMTA